MWERAFAFVDSRISPMMYEWGPVERIHDCNAAYSMDALKRVGNFREEFDGTEDCEMHRRIQQNGGTLMFDRDITVFHYKRDNLRGYLKQHFWYGVGKGRMLRRDHRATKLSNIGAIAFPCHARLPLSFIWHAHSSSCILARGSWYWLSVHLHCNWGEANSTFSLCCRLDRLLVILGIHRPNSRVVWTFQEGEGGSIRKL